MAYHSNAKANTLFDGVRADRQEKAANRRREAEAKRLAERRNRHREVARTALLRLKSGKIYKAMTESTQRRCVETIKSYLELGGEVRFQPGKILTEIRTCVAMATRQHGLTGLACQKEAWYKGVLAPSSTPEELFARAVDAADAAFAAAVAEVKAKAVNVAALVAEEEAKRLRQLQLPKPVRHTVAGQKPAPKPVARQPRQSPAAAMASMAAKARLVAA